MQKTVSDDLTTRECGIIDCVPRENNHVCVSDLCNAATGHLHVKGLLTTATAMTLLLLGVVVVRYIR